MQTGFGSNAHFCAIRWTEGCSVTLDLVMLLELDAPATDLRHTTAHVRDIMRGEHLEWKGPPIPAHKLRFLRSGLMRLCPSHAHSVLPQTPKK